MDKFLIEDEFLGTLKFDVHLGMWSVDVGEVVFRIQAESAIPLARELARDLEKLNTRVKAYVCKKFLKVKNEEWFDEDDDGEPIVVSAKEFRDRLNLTGVSVYEGGLSSLWLSDGDLFDGNTFEVRLRAGRFVDANMHG